MNRWPLVRMFDTGDHGCIGYAVAISMLVAKENEPWQTAQIRRDVGVRVRMVGWTKYRR